MQQEMENGGKLFFDLFVAMANHMVSLVTPSMCCRRKDIRGLTRTLPSVGRYEVATFLTRANTSVTMPWQARVIDHFSIFPWIALLSRCLTFEISCLLSEIPFV